MSSPAPPPPPPRDPLQGNPPPPPGPPPPPPIWQFVPGGLADPLPLQDTRSLPEGWQPTYQAVAYASISCTRIISQYTDTLYQTFSVGVCGGRGGARARVQPAGRVRLAGQGLTSPGPRPGGTIPARGARVGGGPAVGAGVLRRGGREGPVFERGRGRDVVAGAVAGAVDVLVLAAERLGGRGLALGAAAVGGAALVHGRGDA